MSDCRICDTGMLRTLWYEITGYPAIDGASHHVQHAMRGGMEVCYKHAGVMLESGLCDDPQPVADTIQTAGGQ